jgi:hypothetical protein
MGDMDRLLLRVMAVPDSDVEELADLCERLRVELQELDLPSVAQLAEREAPEWAKGFGQLTNWLIVQFATLDGLRSALAAVRRFTARTGRTVEVSIDGDSLRLTAATAQQQEQVIDAWLARHSPFA